MNAQRPTVGIYRTSFPLYSETFISEQVRALSHFAPRIVARTPHSGADAYDLVSLSSSGRSLESLLFTAFGRLGCFARNPRLSGLSLLHAHFAPDAVLALPIARHLGIPLIATCHGSDVTVDDWHILLGRKLSGWRYLLQRGALFDYGSKFVAVSDFLRDRMITAGYPRDKVVRHYVGVDTSRFVPNASPEPMFGNKPFVLSVARHTEVKGLDVLIDAFATIALRYPDLLLVQIGSGEQTAVLKARVTDLGLADRVLFLGAQPPLEVLRHMQGCRLLVLSSRRAISGAEESFGLVLTEAASCGIPTVATHVGGIPEAMVAGETGLLVEPDDAPALATAMDTIIANPDLSSAMGLRAREFVRDCFDLHRQTAQLEKIYAEVL